MPPRFRRTLQIGEPRCPGTRPGRRRPVLLPIRRNTRPTPALVRGLAGEAKEKCAEQHDVAYYSLGFEE